MLKIYKNVFYNFELQLENKIPNVDYISANDQLPDYVIKCNVDNEFNVYNKYYNYYTNIHYIYIHKLYTEYNYIGFLHSYYNIRKYNSFIEILQNKKILCHSFNIDNKKTDIFYKSHKIDSCDFLDKYYYSNQLSDFLHNQKQYEIIFFVSTKNIFEKYMMECYIPYFSKIKYLLSNNIIEQKYINRKDLIISYVIYSTFYLMQNYGNIDKIDVDMVQHPICH